MSYCATEKTKHGARSEQLKVWHESSNAKLYTSTETAKSLSLEYVDI